MLVACPAGDSQLALKCLQKYLMLYEKMKTIFQHVIPTWEQVKNTRHIFRNMSDIF